MTNADKFKHYERWATASDFPTDNIVNDGSTDHADRLGSVADLALCLRAKKVVEEGSSSQGVLVIAGDMIFQVFIGKFLSFISIKSVVHSSEPSWYICIFCITSKIKVGNDVCEIDLVFATPNREPLQVGEFAV